MALSAGETVEHLAAFALLALVAFASGWPWAAMLRSWSTGEKALAAMILGSAWWAIALCLLPWPGSLWVYGLVTLAAWLWSMRDSLTFHRSTRQSATLKPSGNLWQERRGGLAAALLLMGMASFSTPLWTQHVPPGMDASMHGVHTQLIARAAGLPNDMTPIAPGLGIAAVNLGLPTLLAVPVMATAGLVTANAMTLAGIVWAYACYLAGLYLLVRTLLPTTAAAVLAVAAVWFDRVAQSSLPWGGFTNVQAVGIGLLAARLLIQIGRRQQAPAALVGLCIAALPLTHGNIAAAWLYVVAPTAVLIGLAIARHQVDALKRLALAGGVTSVILLLYMLSHRPTMSNLSLTWITDWQAQYAPAGSGFGLLAATGKFVADGADSLLIGLSAAALIVLGFTRNYLLLTLAAIPLAGVFGLVLNSRLWLLPGSAFLYPDRVIFWTVPLATLAVAWGWRIIRRPLDEYVQRPRLSWPSLTAAAPRLSMVLAVLLLMLSAGRHRHYYQRKAFRPAIAATEWESLCWAKENLKQQMETTKSLAVVDCPYWSAGSYLPLIAEIAATGWHTHFCVVGARSTARQASHPVLLGEWLATHPAQFRWAPAEPHQLPRFYVRPASASSASTSLPEGIQEASAERLIYPDFVTQTATRSSLE